MKHSPRPRGLLAVIATLALLTACSGPPRVHVASQPETARVYVNGMLVGNTPTAVTLPFDESERVYVQVVHPAGNLVGTQIFTEENLPDDDDVTFNLR